MLGSINSHLFAVLGDKLIDHHQPNSVGFYIPMIFKNSHDSLFFQVEWSSPYRRSENFSSAKVHFKKLIFALRFHACLILYSQDFPGATSESCSRWWFQIFLFSPLFGEDSHIFQMGWNHQPVVLGHRLKLSSSPSSTWKILDKL